MSSKALFWDFDNTIHDGNEGYKEGEIYGLPMRGALHFLPLLAKQGYENVVFTARPPEQWPLVKKWLDKYGFPSMRITNVKEPARIYIDNRAIRFEGPHSFENIYYYLI